MQKQPIMCTCNMARIAARQTVIILRHYFHWGPVYTGPDKFLHGQKLARFHLAFTRDRRKWTNFLTAKCASLGPEKSRSTFWPARLQFRTDSCKHPNHASFCTVCFSQAQISNTWLSVDSFCVNLLARFSLSYFCSCSCLRSATLPFTWSFLSWICFECTLRWSFAHRNLGGICPFRCTSQKTFS